MEQENIDQMYADEMQTQMDYEAQMAEQEMYESQMYADMQQESASFRHLLNVSSSQAVPQAV